MGTAVKGKDLLIHIHDGGDPGGMVEVPYQGDATYNPGKSSNISVTKNGKHPYQTEEGATITFSFEKERPALAVHTRLRTLSQTGDAVAVEYKDSNSGGESYSGNAVITLGEEESGVEGVIKTNVTIAFVDDPVIGNVA
ncbi:phage tail protein [Cognatishimia sp. MH4019]|uniref:phage tail protein n=1 Tax=Rhodobacterales TaxID=204455 RepID=UPI001CD529CD|nr:phage tail protein [Cognatishimia sp. MH4019]